MYLKNNKLPPMIQDPRMIKSINAILSGDKVTVSLPSNIPDPQIVAYKIRYVDKSWRGIVVTADGRYYNYEIKLSGDKPNENAMYYLTDGKYGIQTPKTGKGETKSDKQETDK